MTTLPTRETGCGKTSARAGTCRAARLEQAVAGVVWSAFVGTAIALFMAS